MRAARPKAEDLTFETEDRLVALKWRSISASICWRNSGSRCR
jgi:hypothetical protein